MKHDIKSSGTCVIEGVTQDLVYELETRRAIENNE